MRAYHWINVIAQLISRREHHCEAEWIDALSLMLLSFVSTCPQCSILEVWQGC
jgi:hypothetical protein